jgi:hypothetical protein
VIVDGQPAGKTGEVILLEPGRHSVALDPVTGANPPQQHVVLKETSPTEPLIVPFERTDTPESSPSQTASGGEARARAEPSPESVPEGWVPITRGRTLKPSRTMMQAMESAERMALDAGLPIDSTLLLCALANTGQNQKEVNTAALLVQSISGGAQALEVRLQEHFVRQPDHGRWRDGPVHFTAGAWRVLESARELQAQISRKDPYVAARHVMAAFLTAPDEQPPDGALGLLTAAGLNLDRFRDEFRERMLASKLPDDPDAWHRLPLRPVRQHPVISRFNPDLSAGEDRLGIRRDVNAMANLMASRALEPPLSIGLFGNWGSGKSFFITKLAEAVRALSDRAREDHAGFRDAYWPKIVQVKFNAWHFVDANLWASLVSHVFEELNRCGKDEPALVQAAKAEALDALRVATEARAAAEVRLKQAKDARAKAERVRDGRIAAFEARRDQFALAVGKDVWKELDARLGDLGVEERTHLRELGIAVGDTVGSAERVYSQLAELRTLSGRIYAAGTLMAGGGAWKLALVVFLLMTAAVGGLAFYANSMGTLVSILGQTAALVTSGVLWFGRSVKRVSTALEPLQRLHANLETRLKEVETKKAEEVAQLDKEVQRLQADCAEATKTLDQTEQKVQAAQAELEAAATGQLITRFIEQRADSSDYRKHLGIVSLIRDDFDRLSGLIKAYNDSRLSPLKPGAPAPADLGINRIILYIDDLDRCPPDRVVEVLQAIHLLLAFPLFVVVVAVDARWMSSSLQTQYRGMLVERGSAGAANADVVTAPATPRDYLEKIFQVPFWVQPMIPAGCQSLIEELLKFDTTADTSDPTSRPTVAAANAPSNTRTATPGTPAPAGAAAVDPSPEQLRIDHVEAAAMAQLAPIIGRSPRATKRFVNVYRLLKAAVPADTLDAFVGSLAAPGDFRAPMLLLAVTTGLPMLTPHLFHDIAATSGQRKATERRVAAMFKKVIREGPSANDEDVALEQDRLRLFLATRESTAWTALPVRQLKQWLVRIAQFTFDARAV